VAPVEVPGDALRLLLGPRLPERRAAFQDDRESGAFVGPGDGRGRPRAVVGLPALGFRRGDLGFVGKRTRTSPEAILKRPEARRPARRRRGAPATATAAWRLCALRFFGDFCRVTHGCSFNGWFRQRVGEGPGGSRFSSPSIYISSYRNVAPITKSERLAPLDPGLHRRFLCNRQDQNRQGSVRAGYDARPAPAG
jgi:hypothetical protein